MKPLELTVHPPVPDEPQQDTVGYWDWALARQRERTLSAAKRFTDAELAAEHHAAILGVYRAKVHLDDPHARIEARNRALDWMAVTRRFATYPNYDDPEACASADHDGVRQEVP